MRVSWILGVLVGGTAALTGACGSSGGPASTVNQGNGGASAGSGGQVQLGGGAGSAGKPAGGMGGIAGAGGEPVRAEGPAEWLTYETDEGIYAFDVKNYPAVNRVIRLGDAPNGSYGVTQGPDWTRDGSKMMEFSGDSLLVWDMTGMTPSEPLVLATGLKATDRSIPLFWSADNKTVFLVQETSLYALDATKPMSPRNLITTDVVLHQPAPKGSGLIYDDATGMNYVNVVAGVPGKPQLAEAINADWNWSPDGIHFGTEGTSVKIFDTSAATLTSVEVAPITLTYSTSPSFSFDGTYFAYNAGDGAQALMYGSVAAPAQIKPLKGTQPDSEGRGYRWHPTKPLVAYNVVQAPAFAESTEWVVSDVSGAEPSAPIPLPSEGAFAGWLGDGDKVLLQSADHKQMLLADLAEKPPSAKPFSAFKDAIGNTAMSPDKKLLALSTHDVIHLVDLADPSAAVVDIKAGGQADATPYAIWTSDSQYLVLAVHSGDFKERSIKLTRVDSARKYSPLVTLVPAISDQVLHWSMQPRPKAP